MSVVHLVGLIEVMLPDADPVRISEGGVVSWGGNVFRSIHPLWGAIAQADDYAESIGAQVPDANWTMNLPDGVDPADVAKSDYQGAAVSMWIADYDPPTSTVIGDPELEFLGQIDVMTPAVGSGKNQVTISAVPLVERLFEWRTGNSLNPKFHKRCFAGETGEDNATSLTTTIAWGVAAAPGQSAGTATGAGAGGGGGIPGYSNERAK